MATAGGDQQRAAVEREQRARVEGVLLTARDLTDRVGNALTVPLTTLELLREDLGPAHELAGMIRDSIEQIALTIDYIAQLHQLVRVETRDTPVGPALDLQRSVEQDPGEPV